jgi:hypothetical protein
MIVYYSRCRGRPPGEHRRKGNTVTWGAWWTGNPKTERGRKPDAYGGAPTKAAVEDLVRQFAARTAAGRGEQGELEPLSHSHAFDVKDMIRGGPPPKRTTYEPPPRPAPGTPEYERLMADIYRRAQEANRFNEELLGRFRALFGTGRADSGLAALGLATGATEADVRRAFRRLAPQHHPDRGGSEAAFKELNGNYQAALRVVMRSAPREQR